ncbi:cell division protein ZapC [Shewanella sp. NIFS-20-20]|uniref:cell division protein ZapC n=1 Tax=Shewanella sp. NIFS-20-20 TaxID=2853806 RepID=UPI001C47D79C|nr:cell division protein ZapC [Shewanella sp. NIFS-20-20]MBV7314619.1 cell division protein ZapC [Shewanella sp. NIFS-20-20]
MLLMPQRDWQWGYNDTHHVLGASLGSEMEFLTPYAYKQLIPDARGVMAFNMDHAKYYIELIDKIKLQLNVADAQLVQVALNATAARFMLTPQMPRSWFFNPSHQCVYGEVGKVVELETTASQRTKVLIVETSLQAALVMILNKQCHLTDQKHLQRFDVIKVMHDRLHPPMVAAQSLDISAA